MCIRNWRRCRAASARAGYGFRRSPPPDACVAEPAIRRFGRRGPGPRMRLVKNLKAGQAQTEYALILMLVGITVSGALTFLGQSVHEMWHTLLAALPRHASQGRPCTCL